MDKLEQIFSRQKELDAHIIDKRNLAGKYTPQEWIQKKCLALIDETAELLNEVNYKWWKNPKEINKDAIGEELVDMLHFWVSMCIDAGLTAADVHNIYMQKNQENHNRQNGKSKKEGYAAE